MPDANIKVANFKPDNLIEGNEQTQPITLAAGEYKRGEVLGRVGNIYGKLSTANSVAAAIMPFTVNVTAQTTMAVYVGGSFNQAALFLDGKELEDVKTALRDCGIFIRQWGAAPDIA